MAWFQRSPGAPRAGGPQKKSRMGGLWLRCDGCGEFILKTDVSKNIDTCPACGHHYPMAARRRLDLVCDPDSFREHDAALVAGDPLEFADQKRYRDRIKAAQKSAGERDAFVAGLGHVDGREVSIGAFHFSFMGGSMGSVVGEKVTRLFERAVERRCPAVVFCASGGARMQEGILSLMQMAKTSAAIARLRAARLPYVSVMLHPTTGGVAASFAWLGDVIFAEPGALIGFAGPRVIEQTIRQKLPEGFQRSEFLLEHGMVDAIVPRAELRARIALALSLLG